MDAVVFVPLHPQRQARSGSAATSALRLGCLALSVLGAGGCATSSSHNDLVAFLRSYDQNVATGHYTVAPPDVVTIHAPNAPEIDGVTQRLRPDGKLGLRLLGEVHVAGLTTQEIAEKLRTLLSRYYVDPEVVIEIADFRSQKYFVFGQVTRPGPKPFTGRDTLLQALAEANPTFLAWTAKVRVVRPGPTEDSRKTIVVDVDNIVRGGDLTSNVLLQEGDIIEVPPTPLAWFGLRVRELLYPVEPVVQAYTRPATMIDAQNTYEGRDYR